MVAMALLFAQALSAADFNPLELGTLWTYQSSGEQSLKLVYEVESSTSYKGGDAVPIVTRYQGTPIATTFYTNDGDTAGIVGDEIFSTPITPARPLFKVGEGEVSWTYSGSVPFDNATAPISLKGSSHRGAKRTFAGKEYETLEVTIDAMLTPTNKKKKPLTQHQEAVYGCGIGLLEMTMTGTVEGVAHKQHLELIKFDHRGKTKG